MSTKVRVENFQSIREAEVEIDGLTVITGPNNSGKSALMRAIRGVFTNTGGTAFVRRGADKMSVELTFDEGNRVKWEKGAKIKPTYTVNGKEIQPGRQVPDEVMNMGVRPVRAGTEDLWPQIAPQIHGQVFLINKPGSAIAEAVADVERVGTLNGAMRLADKDLRSNKSTQKIRRQDEEDLADELEQFDGLDDIIAQVEKLEAEQIRLSKISKAVLKLRDLRKRKQGTEETIKALKGIKDLSVPGDDAVETLRGLQVDLRALTALGERKQGTEETIEALKGIKGVSPPQDDEVEALREIQKEIQGLTDLKDRHASAQADVETLEGADELSGMDLDEGRLPKLWEAYKLVADLKRRWEDASEAVEGLQEKLADANKELLKAQDEVDSVLFQLEACPTCGAETQHVH